MSVVILIIDDEDLFREDTASLLREEGYRVETAPDGETGLEAAREHDPDIVLCDIVMPGPDGIDILPDLLEGENPPEVLMVTAHGTLETAIEAFREGAYDYLLKPVDLGELTGKVERIVREYNLREEVRELREEVSELSEFHGIIGETEQMREVYELIEKVAPTESNVLVTGESGTGKELVARAIHNRCYPAGQRFVPVNCAAVSDNLLESELFGHVKGAFTGATQQREGVFEVATGGTLFLDEISEMAPGMQSKLLRAIESGEISPVGSSETRQVDPRIIAASNRDVGQMVEENEFREDLYYRLNVFEIHLPPLRERKEDLPLLINHFIEHFNREMNTSVTGVQENVLQSLLVYPWPGNVRELKNMVERAVILQEEGKITPRNLPPEIWQEENGENDRPTLKEAVHQFEQAYIKSVLEEYDGNQKAAAKALSIDRSTLYRKLKEEDDE